MDRTRLNLRAGRRALPALAAGLLAACGAEPEPAASPVLAEPPLLETEEGEGVPRPAAPPPTVETHFASGIVTDIDFAAGTVSVTHEAFPEAGLPAGVSAFQAQNRDALSALVEGQRIEFRFRRGLRGELILQRVDDIPPADDPVPSPPLAE